MAELYLIYLFIVELETVFFRSLDLWLAEPMLLMLQLMSTLLCA